MSTEAGSVNFIYDFHTNMEKHNLILAYEGEFTQEITKSVLAMAERNLDSDGAASSTRKKVFNVMVECLQNICKHHDKVLDEEGRKSAIFMIGKIGEEYVVITGNLLENDVIDNLKARIDKVNSLDKDELKAYHKEVIRNTEISEVGGAGLGFIDMARKAGHKLLYDFKPGGDGISFYTLYIRISNAKRERNK